MLCHSKIILSPILSHKIIYAISIASLIFILTEANGQEPSNAGSIRLLSSLPFQMLNGGTIVVKTQLGKNPDTLNFIFDTGSDGISLDSVTCEKLSFHPSPSNITVRGIAGIRKVSFLYNQILRLPNLDVDSLNFQVNDYSILTSFYGRNVDGIIGYSFLKNYIIKIDYDSFKISVYSKGSMKYPKGGFLTHPYMVSLPVESARVKENAEIPAQFYFDTGAGLCLLLSSDFVNDKDLFDNKKRKPVETLAEGPAGKTTLKQTTVKEFRFGPYHFKNVPTYIFDDQYNITSYPSMAGLIGNDLLRRFNIILNYSKREIYLIPNSHFHDVFDYSYTGLSLYWVNEEIRVADVIKNSPAYSAGFKEDDIIVAVGNNFTGNFQSYKDDLQNANGKINVIIKRANYLLELKLKVKNIL